MFEQHAPLTYVWLGLASLVIGFGWSAGCWLFGLLVRPRTQRAAP